MTVRAAVRDLGDEWETRPDRAFICSKETRHRNTTKRDVTIGDARPLVADGSIDIERNGFTFAAYEYHFTSRKDGGFAAIPTWSANHRFYDVSNMRPGEAFVFKQYDSRPGMPKVCPHTAFYGPLVGENQPGRRSVEFRPVCIL